MRGADSAACIERPHHRDGVELGQGHVERSGNDRIVARVCLREDEVEHRAKKMIESKVGWVKEL